VGRVGQVGLVGQMGRERIVNFELGTSCKLAPAGREIFDNKTINPVTKTTSPKITIDRNKFIYNFYGYIRMK